MDIPVSIPKWFYYWIHNECGNQYQYRPGFYNFSTSEDRCCGKELGLGARKRGLARPQVWMAYFLTRLSPMGFCQFVVYLLFQDRAGVMGCFAVGLKVKYISRGFFT